MQPILLINFEHATPAMAELGLEHLFGPLFQAVFTDDTDALKAALTAGNGTRSGVSSWRSPLPVLRCSKQRRTPPSSRRWKTHGLYVR